MMMMMMTTQNSMKINYSKTKEMLLGPLSEISIPRLVINYSRMRKRV